MRPRACLCSNWRNWRNRSSLRFFCCEICCWRRWSCWFFSWSRRTTTRDSTEALSCWEGSFCDSINSAFAFWRWPCKAVLKMRRKPGRRDARSAAEAEEEGEDDEDEDEGEDDGVEAGMMADERREVEESLLPWWWRSWLLLRLRLLVRSLSRNRALSSRARLLGAGWSLAEEGRGRLFWKFLSFDSKSRSDESMTLLFLCSSAICASIEDEIMAWRQEKDLETRSLTDSGKSARLRKLQSQNFCVFSAVSSLFLC